MKIEIEPYKFLKEMKTRIVYCWQRYWKGYADEDLWCFHWFIADLLYRGLKDFRGSRHDSGPESLGSNRKWNKALDIMIEGFKAAKEISNDEYLGRDDFEEYREELYRKFNTGMDVFKKYFFHLWT